jgi:asparagine synthase (glutamine-hydrolysing)
MCGIAGFLGHQPTSPDDHNAVRTMTAALIHRGPDADGFWHHGHGVLGHRRLSIIDLDPVANQPLLNEDGKIAVVVNGEIYNYRELRAELLKKGHRFVSQSDSEVVVHLYEELGSDCVERLEGMFAFLLYDANERRLLVARDRAGQKPLYYRLLPHGVAFASELRPLVVGYPNQRAEVDLAAIDSYLTLQYVPSPGTAFKGIYKLPAAHYAVFEPGSAHAGRSGSGSSSRSARPVRYWQRPKAEVLRGTARELTEELLRLTRQAVRRRLMSDVPLGAFLSGGMDSSSIVALMASELSQPVKTFSIGFPHADDSELRFARLVAERYQTDHHEEVVSPQMTDVIVETVRHHGEPFADSSAVAMYYLSRMARKSVTVALSGDAADENFAGYHRHSMSRLSHTYADLPTIGRPLLREGLRLFGRAFAPHFARYADRLAEDDAHRHALDVGRFSLEEKAHLYLAPMREVASDTVQRRFAEILARSNGHSRLARLCDLDWQTFLVDDINVKVDIASMSHSLEVRCPFLDREVVEFAGRLPRHALMRLRGKYLLRRGVKPLLPPEILRRKKRGFALPLVRWLRTDLREMTRDVLLDSTTRQRGLFNPGCISELIKRIEHDDSLGERVWTLLVLEQWFREFIDQPVARAA